MDEGGPFVTPGDIIIADSRPRGEATAMPIMTGLSGNEIFCLQLKGLAPGELVLGNTVGSLGFLGGVGAGFRGILGGEITQVTEMISEGRHPAQARLIADQAVPRPRCHRRDQRAAAYAGQYRIPVGRLVRALSATRAAGKSVHHERQRPGSVLFGGRRLCPEGFCHRQRGLFDRRRPRRVRRAQDAGARRDQGIQRHLQRHAASGAGRIVAEARRLNAASRPASCRSAPCTRCS